MIKYLLIRLLAFLPPVGLTVTSMLLIIIAIDEPFTIFLAILCVLSLVTNLFFLENTITQLEKLFNIIKNENK